MLEVDDCSGYVSHVAGAVAVGVDATVSVCSNPSGVNWFSCNWCFCLEVQDEVADVSHSHEAVLYRWARGTCVKPAVIVFVD